MRKACKAFSKSALAKGARIEKSEHPWATKAMARRIAGDHLCEKPSYYAKEGSALGDMSEKDPKSMTAGQINKELDRLGKLSLKNTDALIAAGRGHERPSERKTLTDPLSVEARAIADREDALRNEIRNRYGPDAPSRLPYGFRARRS